MGKTQIENEIKIFLASSAELELERVHIGDLCNDINSLLADTAVRLRLLKWEVFDPLYKGGRKQSEYDRQVKKADIFIALFRSIAGQYTLEEIDVAISAHAQNQKPQKLYCFIQDWREKREFGADELKAKLGADFVTDSFSDIKDLKLKLIKILTPRLCACGINVTETEKFIRIGSENILRKTGQESHD